MRPVFTACIPVFLMFSACLPPPLNDCSNTSCTAATTSSATVGDDPPLPTSGIHTVTGAEDTSSSTTEDPPGTSTGEPAPPVIVEVERAPNPITSCGAVAITVHTTDTTKVQMASSSSSRRPAATSSWGRSPRTPASTTGRTQSS
jgi:hypothetical protein